MNKTLCHRLRSLRQDEKHSQAEIARLIDVNRSTYGAYERGTILPPMDKIQKLADLFAVSVDYLVGNTNDRTRSEIKALDVSEQVRVLMKYLQDNEADLTLDGAILDQDSRDALMASLENSLRMAQIINKRKG